MKRCPCCKEIKAYEFFPICKRTKDGYYCWCKSCSKEKVKKHYKTKAGYKARQEYKSKESYKNLLERRKKCNKIKEYGKNYSKTETFKKSQKEWRAKNKAKVNFWASNRRASQIQATPPWLTEEHLEEIKQFYVDAKECQWLSDEKLNVDHIIPLQGDSVSGLHVPWNLQIIPERKNFSKGNKLLPELEKALS